MCSGASAVQNASDAARRTGVDDRHVGDIVNEQAQRRHAVSTTAARRRPTPPQTRGKAQLTRTHGAAVVNVKTGKDRLMVRHVLLGLGAAALVGTTFVPAFAMERGHATGARTSGARTGTIAGNRANLAGAGVANRTSAYRGAYYGNGYRPGWGAAAVGAAAVGAAAVGSGYYYNNYYNSNYNNCYRDPSGQILCPSGQYGY
jgi:hypothetical protein